MKEKMLTFANFKAAAQSPPDHFTSEILGVCRDSGGDSDRLQQVRQDHWHGHPRQDLLHHHQGSNKLMLEADRSLHDALCVIRCLVKKRFLIAGEELLKLRTF